MGGTEVTYVGTCRVCGSRFACFDLATSHVLVLMHHNSSPKTRCDGAGAPPIEGSVMYWVPGRPIVHEIPEPDV
jgi:hypothetical protein